MPLLSCRSVLHEEDVIGAAGTELEDTALIGCVGQLYECR